MGPCLCCADAFEGLAGDARRERSAREESGRTAAPGLFDVRDGRGHVARGVYGASLERRKGERSARGRDRRPPVSRLAARARASLCASASSALSRLVLAAECQRQCTRSFNSLPLPALHQARPPASRRRCCGLIFLAFRLPSPRSSRAPPASRAEQLSCELVALSQAPARWTGPTARRR